MHVVPPHSVLETDLGGVSQKMSHRLYLSHVSTEKQFTYVLLTTGCGKQNIVFWAQVWNCTGGIGSMPVVGRLQYTMQVL